MKDQKDFDALLQDLNEKNLEQYAKTHLSAKKQQKLQEILNDKSKLDSLLNSPQAQELMKKLKGHQHG
ncbi:MAG: hypothetical protein IJJ41_06590 [Clostridia bacterium]|nr:hypothetical protein [Clostridia bacterium]